MKSYARDREGSSRVQPGFFKPMRLRCDGCDGVPVEVAKTHSAQHCWAVGWTVMVLCRVSGWSFDRRVRLR